jgi:hypothetical protein
MIEVNMMIYTLSVLVALLSVLLISQKVRRRKQKLVDPWGTRAPSPKKKMYAKERMAIPRMVPPPAYLFRRQ